jgi:hypothetical protein
MTGTRRARRRPVTRTPRAPKPETAPIAADVTQAAVPAAVVVLPDAEPTPVEGSPRRRRASVGGHALKLHARLPPRRHKGERRTSPRIPDGNP